ncbi:MAG TPA: prohibitin family protein [Dongiaceae bacterium]|jgi:prohibitin 2|nr:prohibitin family protein [Dongiaceae bacterium]
MNPQTAMRLGGGALLIFAAVIVAASGTYTIQPGYRGVAVTLGQVAPDFKPEGFGFKSPFLTKVYPVSIRQQTEEEKAECYSSDLQQVTVVLRVLYRIPEASVTKLFQGYQGDPFESLVAPRVQEGLKEAAAQQSAEQIVKNREAIKAQALDLARKKIGTLLVIEDLVIEDIALTKELERAIEQKMVQEQEAAKAKFTQQRAQIEADTAVIKATGEAKSIVIRGEALKENPAYVDLQIVDRWDGIPPQVVGGGGNVMLTLPELQQSRK